MDLNSISSYPSFALDSQNRPHITYTSSNPYKIKYASFNGAWTINTVDELSRWPASALFGYSDVEVDDFNNILITYPLYDGAGFVELVYYDFTHGYKRLLRAIQGNDPRFKINVLS